MINFSLHYSYARYIAVLILLLAECSLVSASSTITVTDYTGRTILINRPVTRIVALAPHIVENVFSAGVGHLLVGSVNHSDYPKAAKKVPQVGSLYGVSLESVIDLNPDLVILWPSGVTSQVSQKLISLGVTVYMDEPRKLEDVAKSIRDIGVLTGYVADSEQAANDYLQQLFRLRDTYSKLKTVTMLYQIWDKPLQTINGQHIINDVIQLCGGYNIFSSAVVIAPKINIESVLALNPEAIVASGMGESRPDWLNGWKEWKNLNAVSNNHLFFIPPDLLQRHTTRILQGAEILCQQLEQVRARRVIGLRTK